LGSPRLRLSSAADEAARAERPIFRRVRTHLCALSVLVACAALGSAATAGAATRAASPLGPRLAKALRVPHITPSRSAAVAVDLATGEELFAQNGSLPLAPASNEKLPLTYALLTALGPKLRFATEVAASGEREGATLSGSLFLVGGGDPSLSSADLRKLAQVVRAAGIRRVDGGVVGDESLFDTRRTAPGWKPSFYIEESPPLSALVVDRARYAGHVSRVPALAAALLFRDALRKAGVVVRGPVSVGESTVDAITVASVDSPPLSQLIQFMDQQSDNFTAEMLLKQLGLLQADRGTTAAGAQTVMRLLGADGIPLQGVRFVDGSGLSLLDRLTADALVAILRGLYADPTLRPFLIRSLPVAGKTGTLRRRMTAAPLQGNVLAKTGTTREASALAGFIKDRYAFAVIQNGHPLSYWWARVAQDRFARVLLTG
jgi:D-alanyl-D-alanine carboxypeptidase/D-alanyl-D-alanine-endopeptidase (penicillin-binding protein 4)